MKERLRRALASPRARFAIPILAALLALPSLANGLAIDDFVHRRIARGEPTFAGASRLDLFVFATGRPEDARVLGRSPRR